MKLHTWTVAVDFDGVLHNPVDRDTGRRMGKPFPGALQAMRELHQMGAKIIVHTVRANTDKKHVEEWLLYFGFPFWTVEPKLLADVYVDDRALRFEGDWDQTRRELLSEFYAGEDI